MKVAGNSCFNCAHLYACKGRKRVTRKKPIGDRKVFFIERNQRLLPELLPVVLAAVVDRLAVSGNGLFPEAFSIWVICRSRLFLFMLTFMLFPLCWLCVSNLNAVEQDRTWGMLSYSELSTWVVSDAELPSVTCR